MAHSEEGSSVEDWLQRLSALQTHKEVDGNKWLQLLYSSYLQRFLSDNNRMWTTGQWMISLSLVPLAAVPSLPTPLVLLNVLFLAIPSTSLIWVWLIIAENHKAFQEKSIEWLGAIERILNVEKPGGPKVARGLSLVKLGMVRKMRWVLAWGISLIWLAVLIAVVLNIKF